jgi:hypothetical protein
MTPLPVVAALGRLTRDRSAVIFGQLLGIGSSHHGRCSPCIAACLLYWHFLVQKEREGQVEHRLMTWDLTTSLSLFCSRSSTREALIASAIPRSYRWIHKPLVPVARVLSPPLGIKAYCRNQYVRIKGN